MDALPKEDAPDGEGVVLLRRRKGFESNEDVAGLDVGERRPSEGEVF
jgi:hypothetical protein